MSNKLGLGNALNLMNAIAFGIVAYVIFCLITNAFNTSTRYFEEYEKIESFLHPKKEFFYFVWIVICLSQGVFAIKQLTPKYRNSAIVQYGIQHHYLLAASVFFARMLIMKDDLLKIATDFLLAFSFFLLIKCQNMTLKIVSAKSSSKDFATLDALILRTPFGIHAAWAASNFTISISTYAVEQKFDYQSQFIISMISLFLLTLFSFALVWNKYPDYATPGVIAYAMIAFATGNMPSDSHASAIKITTGCLAAVNALLIPARYFSYLMHI